MNKQKPKSLVIKELNSIYFLILLFLLFTLAFQPVLYWLGYEINFRGAVAIDIVGFVCGITAIYKLNALLKTLKKN